MLFIVFFKCSKLLCFLHLCHCEMARSLFAGIEEIIWQRWRVKVTSSQVRFRSPQYLAFPCSSQCRGYQLKLAAPGQDKDTTAKRGNWGHGNRTENLGSHCICCCLNTGTWTSHNIVYFKLILPPCAFERGITRADVCRVFQWWTPLRAVFLPQWLLTNHFTVL